MKKTVIGASVADDGDFITITPYVEPRPFMRLVKAFESQQRGSSRPLSAQEQEEVNGCDISRISQIIYGDMNDISAQAAALGPTPESDDVTYVRHMSDGYSSGLYSIQVHKKCPQYVGEFDGKRILELARRYGTIYVKGFSPHSREDIFPGMKEAYFAYRSYHIDADGNYYLFGYDHITFCSDGAKKHKRSLAAAERRKRAGKASVGDANRLFEYFRDLLQNRMQPFFITIHTNRWGYARSLRKEELMEAAAMLRKLLLSLRMKMTVTAQYKERIQELNKEVRWLLKNPNKNYQKFGKLVRSEARRVAKTPVEDPEKKC